MAQVGPVVLEVAGDTYSSPARISLIVWEGRTSPGDAVELLHRDEADEEFLLWTGRADSMNTYLATSFAPKGLHAPHGFLLGAISSGRLLVYLLED